MFFKPGGAVGPYTLVRELGRGGFGVVWLAEKRGRVTNISVALKLPLHAAPDLDALTQEARIWARASGHPNVLPVIDAEIYNEQVVIVSEYVDGGSLADWLRKQPSSRPPLARTVEIMQGVLAGLDHLHSKGVVHRDLKPANVLLQGGIPRLTDFGLARIVQTNADPQSIGGTPMYMAPEAWDGHRTEQADIWSAGVMFHEMLAGRLPFPPGGARRRARAALPPEVPRSLDRIVDRALRSDPERRFSSAAEMLGALRAPPGCERPEHAEASEHRENLVHRLWPLFGEDLREALSLGYNVARREEKTRISTRTFFTAIELMQPSTLRPILAALPEGALPRAGYPELDRERYLLREDPLLSTCLERTLRALSAVAHGERKIGAADVFLDLAKHGNGRVVRHLRALGVTPTRVDELIEEHGLRVLRS